MSQNHSKTVQDVLRSALRHPKHIQDVSASGAFCAIYLGIKCIY